MKAFMQNGGALAGSTVLLAALASIYSVLGIPKGGILELFVATGLAVVFFAVIPVLIIRYIYEERLQEYGWRIPVDSTKSIKLTCVVMALHVLVGVYLATLPEVQQFYVHPDEQKILFFAVGTTLSLAYFAAEEFLFRGFLLFALWNRYRYWGAGLSVLLFSLLHFGKVPLEIGIAAISGVSLVWLSLNTKSFIPAAVVHWSFALTVNVLVNFVYT